MAAVEIMDPVMESEVEDEDEVEVEVEAEYTQRIKNEITQIRNTNREIRLLFAGVIERLQSSDLSDSDRTQQENLLHTFEKSIKESENRLWLLQQEDTVSN